MMSPILTTEDLSIGYHLRRRQTNIVAAHLALALIPGEVVCLIGPNGAGKSTLLRTLTGLQPPLSGQVIIEGAALATLSPLEMARRISVVLTERINVGMLSVFALVSLGRYPYTDWTGTLRPSDHEVIHWALRAVGIEEFAARKVNELSDGERQKVMIARALAQQPHVIMLDEPTAFLDLPRRVEMMRLLRQLSRDTGTAILLSTHDLELALRTADRIWLMPMAQPIQVGAPEDLVLSGAFEQTFQNDGVEFDKQHGSFTITRPQQEHVSLQGEGFQAIWTQKALEREGFLVNKQDNQAMIQVRIETTNGAPSWTVSLPNQSTRHATIYDLITQLREQRR